MTPDLFLIRPREPSPLVFADLAAQQDRLRPELEQGMHRVLHHGNYILGPEVKTLERSLAQFSGMQHCVTCASGTDALQLAMMALGVGPGDAVFVPAFTFMASAETVSLLGAEPRFVDIDPRTYTMDPAALEMEILRCRTEGGLHPRCVMPVDLFGLPADYPALRGICARHDLILLADSAQGFGSTYHGVMACTLADVTATSFFPAKPLGCYGDGGAVFTHDAALAEKILSLRLHGKGTDKYDNVRIGVNSRLDTLQAAILQVKLAAFPQELVARRQVAALYDARLSGHVTIPFVPTGLESAWAQYGVQIHARDAVENRLRALRIPTAVYYPKPLPFQTAYADQGHQPGRFPVAEALSRRILHLPMHPDLTVQEIDQIANALLTAVAESQNA
ncbi:MAG: DegT/DnrJ/EryC1/StrS family aminotransferase [Magnetococcales bacterium]|nr:DegT/DnrJ/EryC1/StrS family aminotransferase [Magnetococcales bacterium]NGZ05108.1 DegT/DnrJ/EryC1/StrS family aminotransferase [Magnetococcales bacterium]